MRRWPGCQTCCVPSSIIKVTPPGLPMTCWICLCRNYSRKSPGRRRPRLTEAPMLDKRSLAEYRRFRGLAPDAVICNAPFVNLSFHVSGKVLACHYHNPSHVLGVYPRFGDGDVDRRRQPGLAPPSSGTTCRWVASSAKITSFSEVTGRCSPTVTVEYRRRATFPPTRPARMAYATSRPVCNSSCTIPAIWNV